MTKKGESGGGKEGEGGAGKGRWMKIEISFLRKGIAVRKEEGEGDRRVECFSLKERKKNMKEGPGEEP